MSEKEIEKIAIEIADKLSHLKGSLGWSDIKRGAIAGYRLKVKNELRCVLDRYTVFLQDKGYLDTDATMEEPNAIDEFIKYETSTDI